MTGPRPLPSPSRLNVGGYGVKLRYARGVVTAEELEYERAFGFGVIVWGRPGTVTPDGSLTVEPEPWAARHYRRAVMRGAGVYRWGLWAMLAPGRPQAQPVAHAGAALPVNGAGQLDALSRAAHGRVRHSVRWKTGARRRRLRKLEALDRVAYIAHMMRRRAEGRRGISGWPADRTAKGRRAARREWQVERLEDRLREIAPAPEEPGGYWTDGLEAELWAMKSDRDPYTWHGDAALPDLLALACAMGDRQGIREVLAAVTFGRNLAAYELAHALRYLERAAYCAFLARRVRRPRRAPARLPRPLYSRAIPPAAPLAPPALA